MQDTDPLQDTVPPRYAIESDEEEDEFNPLSHGKVVREPLTINIKGVGPFEVVGNDLIIASGDAGKYWAQGASLEQQRGGVFVNEIQVRFPYPPMVRLSLTHARTSRLAWCSLHRGQIPSSSFPS